MLPDLGFLIPCSQIMGSNLIARPLEGIVEG